jgi:hypothetical protein
MLVYHFRNNFLKKDAYGRDIASYRRDIRKKQGYDLLPDIQIVEQILE